MRYTSRTCAGKSRGSSRLNRSKSLVSEAREPELLIGRRSAQYQSRDQLTHSGAVFEAVPLVARNAVHEARAVIRPHGQRLFGKAPVARGRPEEEDFLPGWFHP